MKNDITIPVINLTATNSTSTYIKELCKRQKPEEFTTVVSNFQSAGYGQTGNTWESESGKNLLFSFVFYPSTCLPRQQFYLSQFISLAIEESLSRFADGFSIKWPNDIYWQDKKICGIIIEIEICGNTIQQCVPGIGIDVNQTIFRSSAPNPVSLAQITGKEYDTEELLGDIMARIRNYYQLFKDGKIDVITNRYFKSLYRREGMHKYQDSDGVFMAKIIDILPLGTLVLEDNEKKRREYNFKEVSFIIDEEN